MKRKAYLVGIDTYKDYQGLLSRLHGCKADVDKITSVLINTYNFPREYFRVNTDGSADKDSMLNGLNWLLSGAESGDTLVFYFAGHGAQVAALGDNGEEDHLDEVLCPWDFNENNPNTYIRDNELIRLFDGIPPKVNLEVILDCCFSGGMSRMLHFLNFFKKSKSKIRSLTKRARKPKTARRFLSISSTISRSAVRSKNNFILWAACSENQVALEDEISEDVFRGVFSYYFCEKIESTGGNISRGDLINQVKSSLKAYSQYPPLYPRNNGDLQRPVFS